MTNFDYVQQVEPLIFGSYQEFKSWLISEFGKKTKSFVSAPIHFVNDDDDNEFSSRWKLVEHFQSGNVKYRER